MCSEISEESSLNAISLKRFGEELATQEGQQTRRETNRQQKEGVKVIRNQTDLLLFVFLFSLQGHTFVNEPR